ncbi:MAG: hypothetical protein MUP24_06620 [Gillisia sp.]|nr:hypothetical protein [Gillisia sp.]
MKKKRSLLPNCAEAGYCCDKKQYNEASFVEKIKILFHLALCKPCRKYSSNSTKLTKLIEKSNLKSCPEEEKKIWRETIEKEISK